MFVNQILTLKKEEKTLLLEAKIDRLIYALYGLTEAERFNDLNVVV